MAVLSTLQAPATLDDLEDGTARLVIQLWKHDLDKLDRQRGQKKRSWLVRRTADNDLAFKLFREDIRDSAKFLADREYAKCRGIADEAARCFANDRAKELDPQQEGMRKLAEANERMIALNAFLRRIQMEDLIAFPASNQSSEIQDDETAGSAQSRSSSSGLLSSILSLFCLGNKIADQSKETAVTTEINCEVCGDAKPRSDIVKLPCSHGFCGGCLRTYVETSLSDPSRFPPQCCDCMIDRKLAKKFLPDASAKAFKAKVKELKHSVRVYCFEPTCRAFIHPKYIKHEKAKCQKCHSVTCCFCKGGAHDGDCPKDTALQRLLSTAQNEGWQRCSTCGAVVELSSGCNQIQ